MGSTACQEISSLFSRLEASGCARFVRPDYVRLVRACSSPGARARRELEALRPGLWKAVELCERARGLRGPEAEELLGLIYLELKRASEALEEIDRSSTRSLRRSAALFLTIFAASTVYMASSAVLDPGGAARIVVMILAAALAVTSAPAAFVAPAAAPLILAAGNAAAALAEALGGNYIRLGAALAMSVASVLGMGFMAGGRRSLDLR